MVYSYLELSQAVERVGQLVNLWAVVLECSIPRPTRGTGEPEARLHLQPQCRGSAAGTAASSKPLQLQHCPLRADMVCNLTLVDPSTQDQPELAAGVEMLCFAASPEELPHIQRPGDIVRLHRVKVRPPWAVAAAPPSRRNSVKVRCFFVQSLARAWPAPSVTAFPLPLPPTSSTALPNR